MDSQACRLSPQSWYGPTIFVPVVVELIFRAFIDPSDIAALDESPIAPKDVKVDEVSEAQRPEDKRKAQEWAGLGQDPNSNLFVFVGRWSKQKGVDLIADVLPSL